MSDCYLHGKAYFGTSTKQLLDRISPLSIIIIDHEDIDIVAAEDMIRKKVRAVINRRVSFTGNRPRTGLLLLLKHGIPVYDLNTSRSFQMVEQVKIKKKDMYLKGKGQWFLASKVAKYSYNEVLEKLQLGVDNYHCLFKRFAENSFQYGLKEIEEFLKSVKNLPKLSEITNKQVFVIARGYQLEEELIAAKDILQKPNCVTIAVDGAATLLENHLIHPKFIIGDMDSLSDDCHYEHSTFIAHSYLNGRSPGQERLKKKAIRSIAVPFPGLSEDLAIMIAYVSNADHIFTIGCRTSVPELVEKGRSGMASTLLTRMFMGEKVSDWKAIHKLFSHKPTFNNIFWSQFYQEEYKADEG